MDDVVSLALSTLVLIASMIVQPSRASCPRGWVIADGIDRDGRFVCRPERIGCDYKDRICEQPPRFIAGRLYCSRWYEPAQTRDGDGATCKRKPGT